MQRLIFQRTGHPRRYQCASTARKTARHDTFVSHQGLLDPLFSVSLPHGLLCAAFWRLPAPRDAPLTIPAAPVTFSIVYGVGCPARSPPPAQGSFWRGVGCSACGLVPCS